MKGNMSFCLLIVAVLFSGQVLGATVDVAMGDNFFDPDPVTVFPGDTIRWTNQGSHHHTSTSGTNGSPDGNWDSGSVAAGGTFEHTFATAGTFPYYCTFHWAVGMTGTVVVSTPKLDLTVSPGTVSGGDQVTIGVHVEALSDIFDAWAALILSNGQIYSMSLTGSLVLGPVPVARSVPGLPTDLDVTLVNMTVPSGAPVGDYTAVAVFVPAGTVLSSVDDARTKAIGDYFDQETLKVNP